MKKEFFSPKVKNFLLLIGIIFVLIFFSAKGASRPFQIIAQKIAYPFEKTFYIASRSVSEFFHLVGSIAELKKENEGLLKKNSSLETEVIRLSGEKKENEILREQLRLAPKKDFNLEASFVIGQNPQRHGSWILIDKGSSSGIETGMSVIVSDGILVGRIEEVFSSSARVILLTDPSSAVNSADLDTGAKGVAKGDYGMGIVLDLVSQSEVINVGDTVVTSGLGEVFPKGLFIGQIREVKYSEDKLFQQALISPKAKYAKLDLVFVIKK
ncbi:MAG: rod shape-determining protein MreC [Candidatus Moranbacteria bacterium CG10_big_fil_rev_8_21_14_0_10_35_21]|nr:MAG: rod shape-determining protein MreC [Candidatus Moranbacteria bacterium CG10_big_fil_rev_8_21_14_0_10_35_21]PJA88271.1 MAG: rod shape-determining protein MreC [Candidatus Moranbacteria bacterium CG_4_9_14_3_um_filter_36_9]